MHIKNVNGLALTELKRRNHQAFFGFAGVFALANKRNNLVNDIERLESSFENVSAFASFFETERCAASKNFDLMLDVAVESVEQCERARNTVNQRHHVDRETGLQLREFE